MTEQLGRQPAGPSRVWYWVAGAAVVASVVWLAVGVFFGIRSFSRQIEGFQRVPIPGQAELNLDEGGGYTVYFEGLGTADEQVTIPSVSISVAPVGGGEEVPVYPYSGSSTTASGDARAERSGPSVSIPLAGSSSGPREIPRVCRPMPRSALALLRLSDVRRPDDSGSAPLLGGAALALLVAVRRRHAPGRVPAAPAVQQTGLLDLPGELGVLAPAARRR